MQAPGPIPSVVIEPGKPNEPLGRTACLPMSMKRNNDVLVSKCVVWEEPLVRATHDLPHLVILPLLVCSDSQPYLDFFYCWMRVRHRRHHRVHGHCPLLGLPRRGTWAALVVWRYWGGGQGLGPVSCIACALRPFATPRPSLNPQLGFGLVLKTKFEPRTYFTSGYAECLRRGACASSVHGRGVCAECTSRSLHLNCRLAIYTSNVLAQTELLTFLLFWTLANNIVYLF